MEESKLPQSQMPQESAPKASLFGMEAPIAAAIISLLGKAGMDLGSAGYKFFAREDVFQVCIDDSYFFNNHHFVKLILLNCGPHGIYVENISIGYTDRQPIVRLYKSRQDESWGFGTDDPDSITGLPKGAVAKTILPFHLRPASVERLTFCIPEVAGSHDSDNAYGQVHFDITYLNDGKRKSVTENFALRWT